MAVIFLPVCESYASLFRKYEEAIETEKTYSISQSSFYNIWKNYIPEIQFLTPRSDLCMKCKEMRFHTYSIPTEAIENIIEQWNIHNLWARLEREYYQFV
jgi:hypothetical protein